LRQLHEATRLAQILDTVKGAALSGDISSLVNSSSEVSAALDALAAPMDVIIAQKHLNALGATPQLEEGGLLDEETLSAIRAFQESFGGGLPLSGELDGPTAVAIRYSVGCIHAQDLGQ
jgi:peptidoglycan hydrolase-like protein with peptidoglycan-binding domain